MDDDVLAGEDEAADRRLLLDRRRADLAEAAEPVGDAVEHQHPRGDPGAGAAAELDPGGAGVEVGAGRALEAGALQPDPALGVLGPPVVADHPRPAAQLDRLVVDFQPALEAGVGEGGEELGPRQRRLVEPVGREVLAGGVVAVEVERPGGAERLGVDRALGPPRPDLGVADPEPGTGRHRELGGRDGDLRRPRPLSRSIEEDEPDRGVGLGPRPLVDRVPDPDPAPTPRLASLDVEALVVAALGGDPRKPRPFVHPQTLKPTAVPFARMPCVKNHALARASTNGHLRFLLHRLRAKGTAHVRVRP